MSIKKRIKRIAVGDMTKSQLLVDTRNKLFWMLCLVLFIHFLVIY